VKKVASRKSWRVSLTCNFESRVNFVSSTGFGYFVVMSCIEV
jgi:hypothetical protein